MKKVIRSVRTVILGLVLFFMLGMPWVGRADEDFHNDKGVGPIKEAKLGPIDPALAAKGKQIFEDKCTSCHGPEPTGPPVVGAGVTRKMAPEWIMNMILDPSDMVAQDQPAKNLLGQYYVAMPFRDVSQDDARAILEYLRQSDHHVGDKNSNKE